MTETIQRDRVLAALRTCSRAAELVERLGLSRQTIHKHLSILKRLGEVTVQRDPSGKSCIYTPVHQPAPIAPPRTMVRHAIESRPQLARVREVQPCYFMEMGDAARERAEA